jgi:hypothetical protein
MMSALDNVTVARTFHEAWAKRDPDKGAAVITFSVGEDILID